MQRGYALARADELKLRARPRGAPGVTVADTGGRPAGGSGGGGAKARVCAGQGKACVRAGHGWGPKPAAALAQESRNLETLERTS